MTEFHGFRYKGPGDDVVLYEVAGEALCAQELVVAFGRYMLACGYQPVTVDEALGHDWQDRALP